MIKRHLNIKHNYTSTRNKLKTNPQNKTIEQSYQGLQTEGVRCWAEGQEEEEGKHRVRGGVRAPGMAAQAFHGCAALHLLARRWRPLWQRGLTFVLGSEFAHLGWEGLVELVLPRNQGLA